MRLTTMTDYALRMLMYVAQHPDRLCTIAEVASAHAISETHLMKVTQVLGQRGWLETVRGKGGGIRLGRAPADINVGAVVRDVEPDFYLVECMGVDDHCRLSRGCRLTGVINGALENFLDHLDGYTLADLLPPSPGQAVAVALPSPTTRRGLRR